MDRKNLRRTLLGVVAWTAITLGIVGLIVSFALQLPAQLPRDLPPETATPAVTARVTPNPALTVAPSVITPVVSASPSSTPTAMATPSTAPSSVPVATPSPLCDGVVGIPERVAIDALGVDAAVEVLKADPLKDGIGDPDDKLKMGWQAKFPGVKPGACKGTILMDAHTYSDGSAVFKVSYNGVPMAQVDKLGMVAKVATDKGDYYYRIDWQRTVTAEEYPVFAEANDIYDVGQVREERIFFATCSGWNGARYETETVFAGHRIPPP